jgi:hypothetical protein
LAECLDVISQRYGWDDEYILSRPYSRFLQILDILGTARAKENKARLFDFAWHAWLTTPYEQPVTFSQYLDSIGLGEKPEVISGENAIEKAQDVLSRLKGVNATHGTI